MSRIKSIDFLRGMAVILVLFRHHEFFKPLKNAGWIGVDLFFVLSGYLVSSLLFKEYQRTQKIDALRFLIRRGFKIYPLFYVAIIITIFVEFGIKGESLRVYDVVSELIFVQNYFGALWNHTWSLALEEHFYLVLTFGLFLLSKWKKVEKKNFFISICILIMISCLLLRIHNLSFPYSYKTHLFPTHLRFDSLLFGVLMAYLHIFNKEGFERFVIRYNLVLLMGGVILISPAFILEVSSAYISSIGLSQIYLGFGMILMVSIIHPNTQKNMEGFLSRQVVEVIAKIGFYSYGIYLFHMFIKRYGMDGLHFLGIGFHYRIEFIIYFVASILLGRFMSRVVEQPVLSLREKLVPRYKFNK